MKPLLLVMQPRKIRRCLRAIHALDIDKLFFQFMWERDLVPLMATVTRYSGYTHFVLLADDCVPTQGALDLVLQHAERHPCVTGYVNNDVTSPLVNLTSRPFVVRDRSVWKDYAWMTRAEVESFPLPLVPTFFAGSAFTCMPREMWLRYPFDVLQLGDDRGYASDWMLSRRLQRDHVPIVAPRGAFIEHVKEKSNTQEILSGDPEKQLLVTVRTPQVAWHHGGTLKLFSSQDMRPVKLRPLDVSIHPPVPAEVVERSL